MEIEDNVLQCKIDDLEKTSEKQSMEIDDLRATLDNCISRIATLELSIKGNKGKSPATPNSLRVTSLREKDAQFRRSLMTPKTPMKGMRLSGPPALRSPSDTSKVNQMMVHAHKRPWKPPGGTAVIIYPLVIKNRKSNKKETPEPQKLAIELYNNVFKTRQSRRFTSPWRPAGISLLFCNLTKAQLSKHIRLNKCSWPLSKTRSMEESRRSDRTVVFKTDLCEENHKEATYLKEEGALKIFLRGRPVNLYAPSAVIEAFDMKAISSVPEESLQMEWVYGYRGKDCRKNMYCLPTGELVYFVAGIVILHNIELQTQRHYVEHNDDVKCLALHPDKVIFASGQVAGHSNAEGKPHVRVWNSETLQTLQIIGLGTFERAVAAVAFSKLDCGKLLCTVDEANDHNLTLWNWSNKKSIVTAKSSTEAVVEVEFHPKDSNTIVTCGKNHLVFWNVEKGVFVKKTAIYEKYEKPKFVNCIVFTEEGELISGDSSGNIFIWNKDKRTIVGSIVKAHEGPVFSLLLSENNMLLSGGGKDRTILEWDLTTKDKTARIFSLDGSYGCCRCMCQKDDQLLVGTTQNCIVNLRGSECEPLLQGHSEELLSLYNHSSKETFMTGGFDKKIILWDAETHKPLLTKQFDKNIHCIGLSAVSDLCVIGFAEGHWMVWDVVSGRDLKQDRDGVEAIQCCEFSPDGSRFALGSRDNHVYIYEVGTSGNEITKIGKCTGHSSFISHLDWSSDGHHIRTNSGDYELLFWTTSDCKQVTASSTLADIEWATCNCSLSFEVAGIWPEGSDGTDVNAVAKAHSRPILATADDFGRVNLYRFPSSHPKAAHKVYKGHSSHVTGVNFLHGDRHLVSIGGQDTAVVQWRLL